MSAFSFSFSGDDIEEDKSAPAPEPPFPSSNHAAETGSLRRVSNSAFPVAGQPLLKPQKHDLVTMLKALPSKISYGTLNIKLDDGQEISLPRRELWDVRVQLMAEDDDESLGNLGKDDVRTGVYEGGFKSWESSVDVVKEMYKRKDQILSLPKMFLELGCGTALPSLAIFQWLLQSSQSSPAGNLELSLADYNPTVLQLVTLPNLLLSWAQVTRTGAWEAEGELEIDSEVVEQFLVSLRANGVSLSFFSGAWSTEFVELVNQSTPPRPSKLTILGAETIYSPAALSSFGETLMGLLDLPGLEERTAFIAAKKVYFGVGGSMEDFCDLVRAKGAAIIQIREESDGVRRAVVEVTKP